jgi:trans-aconitate methyltransferase
MNAIAILFLLLSAPARWEVGGEEEGWSDQQLVLEYFHHSEPQRQWAWELLGPHPLDGSESVLDFGCGDGKITAELHSCLPRGEIIGVDLSPEMIAMAQKSFPQVPFVQVRNPHFAGVDLGRQFDRIISFCVFHQVPNPKEVLLNLRQMLKEDGQLMLVIPRGGNLALVNGAKLAFEEFGLPSPFVAGGEGPTMRTLEGIRAIVESAHWDIEYFNEVNTPHIFVTRDQFLHWLIGTTAANWAIPAELAPTFFSRLIDHMEVLDPDLVDEAGSYHFRLNRVHLIASAVP